MIKRILIGIGGTPFTAVAIRRAVELANLHGAEVTAVTVVEEARLRRVGPTPLGGSAAASALREHRVSVTRDKIDSAVANLEDQAAKENVRLTVLQEHGDSFGLLTQHARYHDLMIFGLRSMFEYDILGDDVDPAGVLNGLAKAGVGPILAVSDQYRPIRRALVVCDGSMQSAQAMKHFFRMKLTSDDVAVRILACAATEEEAKELLAGARQYSLSYGNDPELQHSSGTCGATIVEEAESWDADLLVLGCSGRSQIASRLFGNTALHVLRHVDRPLLLS